MAKSKLAHDWQIRNLDKNFTFMPPYPVADDGVRIDGTGGNYAVQPLFGQQDEIIQWIGGRSKTYTFRTALFSEDPTDEIKSTLKAIENLAEVDKDLGRPPICAFYYGKYIQQLVMVEAVGINILPIRTPQPSATGYGGMKVKFLSKFLKFLEGEEDLRLVDLDFTMRKYRPFSQIQIDPKRPNKESYYLATSAAEANYEAIARRYYGAALKGDRLRKRNPGMPMQPTVGKFISIPAKDIIRREEVEPTFHALSLTNEEAVKNLNDLLTKRSTRRAVIN